jgi:hypothetical protein
LLKNISFPERFFEYSGSNLQKLTDSTFLKISSYTNHEADSIRISYTLISNDLTIIDNKEIALSNRPDSYLFPTNSKVVVLNSGIVLHAFGYLRSSSADNGGLYFIKTDKNLSQFTLTYYLRNGHGAFPESLLAYEHSDTALAFFSHRAFKVSAEPEIVDSLPDTFLWVPNVIGFTRSFGTHWIDGKLYIGGGRFFIYKYNSDFSFQNYNLLNEQGENRYSAYFNPMSVVGNMIFVGGAANLGGSPMYGNESNLELYKIDTSLNLRWMKELKKNDGFYYFAFNITATSDGGCLITATRNNYTTMGEKLDLYLLKVDSLGNYTPMVGLENQTTTLQTLVYPNPGTSTLTIETSEGIAGHTFRMYNSTGTLMLQQPLQTGTQAIDVSSLPVGIYIYETQNHNGEVERGKWVKMD